MKLIGVASFAGKIGMSPKTVRNWLWQGQYPFPAEAVVRVGSSVRFREDIVDEWIQAGAPKPKTADRGAR